MSEQHHFINLMEATHEQLWALWRGPHLVECPHCHGRGWQLVEEEGTLNMFGVDMRGVFVTGQRCTSCLPTYPGYTYGFCPS